MADINNRSLSFREQRPFGRRLLWLSIFNLTTTYYIQTTSAMAVKENNSLSTMEILQNYGYTAEVHQVITKDGYVLEVHRIPKSKSGQSPTRNHPVLVQHGILGSSADWVLGGPEKSLPMQLADDGYDVWLSNSRGNIYSRKHVSLTYKQRAFWNFCLHELGTYDLPAVIDYILSETKTPQLHYVGFSMGTTIFFIMASERPEYQPKIRSQISLAPVAYLSNTRSILRYVAPYAKLLNIIFQKTSNGMFMPRSKMEKYFIDMMCKEKYMQHLVCEKCIIFSVCGSDPYYFDKKLIPLIFGHYPAGTSSKLTAHFAQFMLKDSFCRFDYGSAMNMLHYNSTEPPVYDLKSIQVPITLVYGKNDILASTKDVMKLKAQLPRLVNSVLVSNPYCNHVDLMWSVNVTGEVNDPVRESLRKTDDAQWSYSGPSPGSEAESVAAENNATVLTAPIRPPATDGPNGLSSYLNDVASNLDAIIASTMPLSVDGGDRDTFDRQRELQTSLYGHAIEYLRSAEAAYGRTWHSWTDGVHDYWTNVIPGGVSRGLADVRQAARTHLDAVRHGVTRAEHAAVSGVARAEHAALNGVARAEHAIADGVARAEHAAEDGISRARQAAVDGVSRAEKTVAVGIAKAEKFVYGGLSKTNYALNATVRGLSKAFWFLK